MSDEIDLDILATPEQQAVIESTVPIQILVAGRRWGKTLTCRNKMLLWAFSKPDQEIVYIAPTYRRALKEARDVRKSIPDWIVRQRLQPPAELELFNGSRMSFLSFDRPDNMRGDPADLIIADEAAKLNGELFWETAFPMLIDRGGCCVLASTFRGTVNWFYEEYAKALVGNDTERIAWKFPTSSGVIFQSESGKARLEKFKRAFSSRPVVWEQECECNPSANSATVFTWLDQCIKAVEPPQCDRAATYLIGMDIGSVVDHSAAVVMDYKTGAVVDCKLWRLGLKHSEMAMDVKLMSGRWNNARVIVDVTGLGASGLKTNSKISDYEDVLGERMKKFIWSPNTQSASKEDVIEFLAREFERESVSIPAKFAELVRQLRAYEGSKVGARAVFSAPDGQHDDYVAALAMAVWGRAKNWINERGAAMAFVG